MKGKGEEKKSFVALEREASGVCSEGWCGVGWRSAVCVCVCV